MKYLYLIINLASVSIPFVFSFHPRLKFYKKWPSFFKSLLVTGFVFIVWDIVFTANGVWGFNDAYLTGIHLSNLPIEEWLFFLCIPYACVFTHQALLELFPQIQCPQKLLNILFCTLLLLSLVLAIVYTDRWYTFVNYSYFAAVLVLVYFKNRKLLGSFFLVFLVILVPFFGVNGILTGSFISDEVVWYNNAHNLGIRILTIPIEDIAYAFSLLLSQLFLMELFQKNRQGTAKKTVRKKII